MAFPISHAKISLKDYLVLPNILTMLKENGGHPLLVSHAGDESYKCVIINQDQWWVEILGLNKGSYTPDEAY